MNIMNEQTTKTHQRKGVCFLSDLLEKLVQARMKKKYKNKKIQFRPIHQCCANESP
jgi:hypothetical protein